MSLSSSPACIVPPGWLKSKTRLHFNHSVWYNGIKWHGHMLWRAKEVRSSRTNFESSKDIQWERDGQTITCIKWNISREWTLEWPSMTIHYLNDSHHCHCHFSVSLDYYLYILSTLAYIGYVANFVQRNFIHIHLYRSAISQRHTLV